MQLGREYRDDPEPCVLALMLLLEALAKKERHAGEGAEEEGARPGPGSDGRAQQQQSAAVSRRLRLDGTTGSCERPAAVAGEVA